MDIKKKALDFAIEAHRGQVRKSESFKPMIIHPINVGMMLEKYGFDDSVVSAGFLHDVVEDTKYSNEDIEIFFGSDIASLVSGASEPDKSLSWEERKLHTINSVANLDLRHKAIIAADKINNLSDIYRMMFLDKDFNFNNFNRGYDKQKWYYTSVSDALCVGESHEIFTELKNLVDCVFNNAVDEYSKYIDEDRFNKLKGFHLVKKEIKNMMNCLERKPFVIEFTGTPRTGKTSIINDLEDFFKKGGFKIKIIEEFTTSKYFKETIKDQLKDLSRYESNCEIPKYVKSQLDELINSEIDIIIVDRSLFDRCIWIDRLLINKEISNSEYDDYFNKYIPIVKSDIDLVVATYCDPVNVMKRDYVANLSLEKRSFLNEENVSEYNKSLTRVIDVFKEKGYEVNLIDTNNNALNEVKFLIVDKILSAMRNRLIDELNNKYS